MWKPLSCICLLSAVLAVGCAQDPLEQPDDVDIRDLTAAQAAEVVSEAMCSKMAQCPASECECWASQNGPTECSCEIVTMDPVECTEDMVDEIYADFQRVDLTSDEEVLVNDCINAFVRQDCLTEAQVLANNEAIEAGGEPIYEEQDMPAECEGLEDIFGGEEPTPIREEPTPAP